MCLQVAMGRTGSSEGHRQYTNYTWYAVPFIRTSVKINNYKNKIDAARGIFVKSKTHLLTKSYAVKKDEKKRKKKVF